MQFYRKNFNAMGTPCEIQLFSSSYKQAENAMQKVVDDVNRLELKYSRYRPDSLLSEINKTAEKGGRIQVDEETSALLNYAQTCFLQSDGLFDITSGLLRQAWNFKSTNPQLPATAQLEKLLAKVGWQRLNWSSPFLDFVTPGMEIDFGGVVKEYAVDRAATLCRENDIHHGVVNLGGDIHVIGPRADDSPWQVGIRHPDKGQSLLKSIAMFEGALASSGDYERHLLINGKRYGHVINPISGWPVAHLSAVSVVSDFCLVAGSAATIAMLKEQQGPAWLEELGLVHIWVDNNDNSGGNLHQLSRQTHH